MEQIQFTTLVLLTLLTIKLLLLPKQATSIPVVSTSRWLMACGTALLAVQFLLQYLFKLRSVGIIQAVMVNLVFFIPCSTLFSLAVLYLQRQGRINWIDKYLGLLTWIVGMALITFSIIVSGQPIMAGAESVFKAEIMVSLLYMGTQGYYTARSLQQLHKMRRALANYYDRDMSHLLNWMQISIFIMAPIAVVVPFSIFFQNKWLLYFCTIIFIGIFYLVDSFCLYATSASLQKVMEAEQNTGEAASAVSVDEKTGTGGTEEEGQQEQKNAVVADDIANRIDQAVTRWTAAGKHLRSGINCPEAADEMHLPRYQFSLWLKQNGTNYREWLNGLRIKEAKRLLKAHPEWSNEAIAQHCGFSDRSYFQKVFKERTGLTPAQYMEGKRRG